MALCRLWLRRLGSFPSSSSKLSKASEPHNLPQQLSKASHLLCHGTSLGPTSCFYWASKLLRGTFWAGLKTLKTSAAAFEGLSTSQPQQLSKASHLLCHGTSLGPTSCFYWASKLLRGTFLAGLQTFKTLRKQQLSKASEPHNPPQAAFGHGTSLGPTNCFYWASKLRTFLAGLKTLTTSAAAFEGLRTSQPSAAAFGHGTSLGPTSCFYWASKLLRGTLWAGRKTFKTSAEDFEGLRTSQPSTAAFGHGTLPRPHKLLLFYWASKLLRGTFWAGLKTLKTSAAAFEGLRTSQPSAAAFGHGTSLGPTSCFYWASKLLRGTFWASLQTLKTSAAAFEGLRTSQPSAAAFGHGTSLGHTTSFYWASKLLRGTFWAGLKTLKTSAAAFEGLRTAPQAVSIGLRNCHVARFGQAFKPSKPPNPPQQAFGHGTFSLGPTSCFYLARFGQALKPSKPPQQLSKASEPQNHPQQLLVMVPP